MKKKSKSEMDDDLRPEYDFSKMRIVARGPKRKVPKVRTIQLEPDVAKAFPDDESVNKALRGLAKAGSQVSRARKNSGQPPRRASRLRRTS
jgi:hypothetical protein